MTDDMWLKLKSLDSAFEYSKDIRQPRSNAFGFCLISSIVSGKYRIQSNKDALRALSSLRQPMLSTKGVVSLLQNNLLLGSDKDIIAFQSCCVLLY